MDFNGNQTVQGPNDSFSAASKGSKRHARPDSSPKTSIFMMTLGQQLPQPINVYDVIKMCPPSSLPN